MYIISFSFYKLFMWLHLRQMQICISLFLWVNLANSFVTPFLRVLWPWNDVTFRLYSFWIDILTLSIRISPVVLCCFGILRTQPASHKACYPGGCVVANAFLCQVCMIHHSPSSPLFLPFLIREKTAKKSGTRVMHEWPTANFQICAKRPVSKQSIKKYFSLSSLI